MAISRESADAYRSKLHIDATFDHNYEQASAEYIQKRALKRGVQTNAHYQSVHVAFQHGLLHGAYYGTGIGFLSAVYNRKVRMIPMYALGIGASYGFLLGASAMYRMEV